MKIVKRLKRAAFTLTPLLLLVITAEGVVRVKYFLMHDRDWNYLTAPFQVQDSQNMDHGGYLAPQSGSPGPQPGSPAPPPRSALVFDWHKPCRDHEVFSEQFGRLMPYSYDQDCLRGDRVTRDNTGGDYRIFVLGGSTVEGRQSDEEMMPTQLKRALPPEYKGRPVRVVNAGHSTYGSSQIRTLYDTKIKLYRPDLVLYYEALNEQIAFSQWMQVDRKITQFIEGSFLQYLHYRSMLWTYLVEKYTFSTTSDVKFWKVELDRVGDTLVHLSDAITHAGGRFVFVTQVERFPRYHRKVDTFDYRQVDRLLDSLKSDPSYVHNSEEISALNQRLVVGYSLEVCKRYGIPVIDILDDVEQLGDTERNALFLDLVHSTWKLDKILGESIAARLKPLVFHESPTESHAAAVAVSVDTP
jgi:hypothetical protein